MNNPYFDDGCPSTVKGLCHGCLFYAKTVYIGLYQLLGLCRKNEANWGGGKGDK